MAGMTKIESYMMDIDVKYEEVSNNSFFINDPDKGLPGLAVTIEDPIVVIRAKVMPIPQANREALFQKLLEFNAKDIIHGAYGLDGDDIVITDTLQYATLDKEEFEATLDSIGMALSRHYSILGAFRN